MSGPRSETEWGALKAAFSFGEHFIPMNAANLCPPPRVVREALERTARAVDADVSFQHRARYNRFREALRAAVAGFLDAEPDEVAIVRNASEGNSIIVHGVDLGPDSEVLITDQNHPSNALAWQTRAARHGFAVRQVSLPAAPADGAALLSAIAGGLSPRTRVLAVSDVSNSTGVMLPVAELCRLGRERGIHVHIDGAQTLGAARVSMRRLGCGSYTASAQKWLMGPRDAGVLFVRSDLLPGTWPSVVSRGFTDSEEPDSGSARKLDALGQRCDGVMGGLAAAIRFVEEIGIDAIEARVRALAGRLSAGLREIPGYAQVTPVAPGLSLGVVVGRFEGADHERLCERLYHEHRIAAAPTGGLRLSPHIYNSMADVDRAVQAVAQESKALSGSAP